MTPELHDQFSLYDAPFVRAGLHCFRRTPSRHNLVENKVLFAQRRDGAILFEELLDRGFVAEVTRGHSITPLGIKVSERPITPDTSRRLAEKSLSGILEAVQQANDSPYAIDTIDEVWISGEYLVEGAKIRQLDLHMKVRRLPQFLDRAVAEEHSRSVLARVKARVPRGLPVSGMPEFLTRMLVFGEKMPLLFREARMDLDALSHGAPCTRLYVKNLGRVKDPILERHPDATGSTSLAADTPTLPDLRPMDGTWVSAYRPWGRISSYGLFRGFNPESLALFSEIPEGLRVMAAGDDFLDLKWKPEQFDHTVDGRERLGIMAHDRDAGVGCILERKIVPNEGGFSLTCRIAECFGREADAVAGRHARSIAGVIAIVAAADGERLMRRSVEAGYGPVSVEVWGGAGPVADYIAGIAKRHLDERQVRIEPLGWSGEPLTVIGPDLTEPERPPEARLAIEKDDWFSQPIDLDF